MDSFKSGVYKRLIIFVAFGFLGFSMMLGFGFMLVLGFGFFGFRFGFLGFESVFFSFGLYLGFVFGISFGFGLHLGLVLGLGFGFLLLFGFGSLFLACLLGGFGPLSLGLVDFVLLGFLHRCQLLVRFRCPWGRSNAAHRQGLGFSRPERGWIKRIAIGKSQFIVTESGGKLHPQRTGSGRTGDFEVSVPGNDI